MYINEPNLKTDLLQVDDRFATLTDVITKSNEGSSDTQLRFEFYFQISQLKAIQQNALSVLITVKKENEVIPVIVPSNRFGSLNTEELIGNILTHKSKLRNTSNNTSFVVTRKVADITSKINNQLLSVLKNNDQSIENKGLASTSVIVSQKQNQSTLASNLKPQKSIVGYRSLENFNDSKSIENKKTSLRMLKRDFMSPTSVTLLTNRTISPQENLLGSLKKTKYQEFDYSNVTKLTNSYLFSKSSSKNNDFTYETYIGQSYNDVVTVKTFIDLLNSQISGSSTLIVLFELLQTVIDSDGAKQTNVLEKVEKRINVQEHVNNFYFSDDPPNVTCSQDDKKITFQIKTKKTSNNRNQEIKVFRKVLDDDLSESYTQVDSDVINTRFDLKIKSFQNLMGQDSIYRFIVYDQLNNKMNQEFTDVVVKNPRNKKSDKLIVIPSLSEGGINVAIYNHHLSDVVSAIILIRDVTIKQKEYSSIELVTLGSSNNVNFVTIKNNLIPYHVYEITSKLIFENGIEKTSSYSTLIEYVPFVGNISENPVKNLTTIDDVSFELNSVLLQDQVGLIKTMLAQVSSEYSEEFLNSRNAPLDKFLAFKVVRYNVLSGEVSDLGILANQTTFLDSERSKLYSVDSAISGGNYKYVIYPLVRDPKTITENSVSLKDEETKKNYKSNFVKNRHPLTLIKGSVVSTKFIENDTKDDMLYGLLGSSFEVDVSLQGEPNIINFIASFFDRKKVTLSWSVDGDINKIDHFILMKEIDDNKTIIGKSHCLESKHNFVYEITKNDLGNIRFWLIPVYQDYLTGAGVYSNYMLINDVT